MADFTPTVTIMTASDAAQASTAAQKTATKTTEEVLKDIESYIAAAAKQGRTNVNYTILKWKLSDDALVEISDTLTYYSYKVTTLDAGEYGIFSIDWQTQTK